MVGSLQAALKDVNTRFRLNGFDDKDQLNALTPVLNSTVSHGRLQPCSGLAGVRKFGPALLSCLHLLPNSAKLWCTDRSLGITTIDFKIIEMIMIMI